MTSRLSVHCKKKNLIEKKKKNKNAKYVGNILHRAAQPPSRGNKCKFSHGVCIDPTGNPADTISGTAEGRQHFLKGPCNTLSARSENSADQ